MAYAPSLDYNNRPGSRLAVSRQQQHPQKRQQPADLQLVDDLDGLDDSLLDSAMISPASAGDRRDSFANSTGLFSPQSSNWEDFSAPALDRTQSLSNNPFFEQTNNNPFTRTDRPHVAAFAHQPPSSTWPLVDRTSDSRTPFAPHANDAYTGDFETPQPYMAVGSSAPSYNGLPNMPGNVRPSSVFPPSAQGIETPQPLSPASGDKWMSFGNEMDPRPLPKRMRQNSPPRSFSPGLRLRGDGIRKKNARFEIPPERNLTTIDQMIQEATNDGNEEILKELKQQKRLLRNRQAALDSRQRKKKHTEDLEKEKQGWSERVSSLEDELANMRLQVDAERVQLEQQLFQAQQQIQALLYEKEDLVAEHTRETGELRKKVNILTEKLSAKVAGPSTVTPCSTEFTDFAAEMNGLTMDQDEWNNYIFVDPLYEQDTPQPPQQQRPQPSNALVVASRPKPRQLVSDADKPVPSGVLLMLLLCGAFAALRSSSVSEDVRAASATMLDNAGVLHEGSHGSDNAHAGHHQLIPSRLNALEPGPSGIATAWAPKATLSGAEFASITQPSGLGIDSSTLDQLHDDLVMPTKDQEAEQLFGLTANQYNSLTSTDFNRPAYNMPNAASDTPPTTDEGSRSPANPRKAFAQALRSMHDEAWRGGKAAVQTRSLLGEQIPDDIVREFRRWVKENIDENSGDQSVKSEG